MAKRKTRSAKAEITSVLVGASTQLIREHGPELLAALTKAAIVHGPGAAKATAGMVKEGAEAVHAKASDAKEARAAQKAAKAEERAKERAAKAARKEGKAGSQPRKRSPLRIVSVNADAPGQDQYNLNGEWVSFRVLEEGTLLGYAIENSRGTRYQFGDRTFEAGQELCLYSGSGRDSKKALYWGCAEPAWDNDRDVVRVLDPEGNVLEAYRYEFSAE